MNPERALGRHSPRSNWPANLAEASVGERVRIGRIVFKPVRSLCDDLDLSRGDRIRVEKRSEGTITVRETGGRKVSLPLHFAHFILVSEPDPPGS